MVQILQLHSKHAPLGTQAMHLPDPRPPQIGFKRAKRLGVLETEILSLMCWSGNSERKFEAVCGIQFVR